MCIRDSNVSPRYVAKAPVPVDLEKAHSTMFKKVAPPPFAEKTIEKLHQIEEASKEVMRKRPASAVKVSKNVRNYQSTDASTTNQPDNVQSTTTLPEASMRNSQSLMKSPLRRKATYNHNSGVYPHITKLGTQLPLITPLKVKMA